MKVMEPLGGSALPLAGLLWPLHPSPVPSSCSPPALCCSVPEGRHASLVGSGHGGYPAGGPGAGGSVCLALRPPRPHDTRTPTQREAPPGQHIPPRGAKESRRRSRRPPAPLRGRQPGDTPTGPQRAAHRASVSFSSLSRGLGGRTPLRQHRRCPPQRAAGRST